LIGTSEQELSQRVFASRNFIDTTSMLVGPWTLDPEKPFGYRVGFDISDWQMDYLNPIDEQGYELDCELQPGGEPEGQEHFLQWVERRFGQEATDASCSEQELFDQFFHSDDEETRLAVLQIASSVADPSEELYQLITEATRDPVLEIRNQARELVIRINRYRGAAKKTTPADSDRTDALFGQLMRNSDD
jgi:hypothetical protein